MDYVTSGYSELSLDRSRPQRYYSTGMTGGGLVSGTGTFHGERSLRHQSVDIGFDQDYSMGRRSAPSETTSLPNDQAIQGRHGLLTKPTVFGVDGRDVSIGTYIPPPNKVVIGGAPIGSRYGDKRDSPRNSVTADMHRPSTESPFMTSTAGFGPPPGLSSTTARSGSFSNLDLTRALSAGNVMIRGDLGREGVTIRPEAKSLLDLIHEDVHHDDDIRRSSSVGPPAYNEQLAYSPFPMHGRRSTSPAPSQPEYSFQMRPTSQQTEARRDFSHQSHSRGDSFTVENIPRYRQHPQQQSQHPMSQQHRFFAQEEEDAINTSFRLGNREETFSSASAYSQRHQNLQGQQVHGNQQQIFFASKQPVNPFGRGMLPQHLQAQFLPNGQTVYVDTRPSHQQDFGYNSAQYQSHPPQNVTGGLRDGYARGQQGNYWNPQQPQPRQQMMYTAADSGSAGQAQFDLGRASGDSTSFSVAGRSRDTKGGRGRRGANTRGRGGDPKISSTSALLEDFRSSKSRDWTIRRIEGSVVEFCQDQNGSRFIQQRLEMGDLSEQQIVVNEVLPAIRRLRNDVFGNYVVQKLFDFGSPNAKAEIRDSLEGEMLPLSLQMYGCRVVQKAFEALDEDDLPRMLREFHHNVLSCIQDQNGNHVIQKCIEVLNSRANKASKLGDTHRSTFLSEQIDFIIDDVLANTTSLSCHPYGCRVLQRILEHCSDKRKVAILDEIKTCHKTLLDDQYGNYVIQHVLQYGRVEDRDSIVLLVVENGLLGLSRQKFASNVVEKLLKYGNGNQSRAVVREMLKVREEGCSRA